MRVYRMTRCVTTLGKTWYSIDKFSLWGYIRVRGLINTYKEFRSGILSFNPYKLRKAIRRLQKLDEYMIYGVPIIYDTDKVVKMSLEDV